MKESKVKKLIETNLSHCHHHLLAVLESIDSPPLFLAVPIGDPPLAQIKCTKSEVGNCLPRDTRQDMA